MGSIARSLVIVIVLAEILQLPSLAAEMPRQKTGSSAKAGNITEKSVHLNVRSRADIKQTFTYSPYPAIPSELEGYTGSQVGGTGTYRLNIDNEGAVTGVTVLKGFSVTAVYDERFSSLKGNPVPALDEVMRHTLTHWRAKPGAQRVVDIYWSFGTQPTGN